jgi:hypothetical protein
MEQDDRAQADPERNKPAAGAPESDMQQQVQLTEPELNMQQQQVELTEVPATAGVEPQPQPQQQQPLGHLQPPQHTHPQPHLQQAASKLRTLRLLMPRHVVGEAQLGMALEAAPRVMEAFPLVRYANDHMLGVVLCTPNAIACDGDFVCDLRSALNACSM